MSKYKTTLDNIQLVNFAQMLVKYKVPTWPNTHCEPCTSELLEYLKGVDTGHYKRFTIRKYSEDTLRRTICTDSAGMLKGFFWSNGGEYLDDFYNGKEGYSLVRYRYGFPDIDAIAIRDMFRKMYPKGCGGVRTNLPDVPGVILFRANTLGIYIGDGMVVSAMPFPGNVECSRISAYDWQTWCYIPQRLLTYVDYQSKYKIAGIKQTLYKHGFYGGRVPSDDGWFDLPLQDAVWAFQDYLNVIPTGNIDSVLLYHIRQLDVA